MPRCRNCKEKFEATHFNQKYCLDPECVKEWVKVESAKQWKQKKKKLKKELLSVQDWTKIAQQTFNQYIRLRDEGKPCISCGNENPKKINAGHFFSSGGHKAVTFDEDNVHLQCEYCNTYLSGNLINYREELIKRIGEERYESLSTKANDTAKHTVEDLKKIIKDYKEKIKKLKDN